MAKQSFDEGTLNIYISLELTVEEMLNAVDAPLDPLDDLTASE